MDFVLEEGSTDARAVSALLTALGRLGTVTTAAAPSLMEGSCRLMVLLTTDASRDALLGTLAALPGVKTFHVRPEAPEAASDRPTRTAQGVARVAAASLEALATSAQDLLLEETRPQAARARRRLVARLYAQATELRLEPFDSVAHRVVAAGRQAGEALGREVRIVIEGGELRLERSLLDALLEPLLHVVRNAVDHGIEPSETRAEAGKPREGRVRLHLESAGDDTRITVEDDGRGLDPAALREAAVHLGFATADEAARLSRRRRARPHHEARLHHGAHDGTRLRPRHRHGRGARGRGGAGGTLELAARPGEGTRISFRFPRESPPDRPCCSATPRGWPPSPWKRGARRGGRGGRPVLCLAGARVPVDEVVGRREIVVQPLPPAAARGGLQRCGSAGGRGDRAGPRSRRVRVLIGGRPPADRSRVPPHSSMAPRLPRTPCEGTRGERHENPILLAASVLGAMTVAAPARASHRDRADGVGLAYDLRSSTSRLHESADRGMGGGGFRRTAAASTLAPHGRVGGLLRESGRAPRVPVADGAAAFRSLPGGVPRRVPLPRAGPAGYEVASLQVTVDRISRSYGVDVAWDRDRGSGDDWEDDRSRRGRW
jgi:hypothetical protein